MNRRLFPSPLYLVSVLTAGLLCLFGSVHAAEAGRLVSSFGDVQVTPGEGDTWRTAEAGEPLTTGVVIKTGRLSGASLQLEDESLIRLAENSRFEIRSVRSNSFWSSTSSTVEALAEQVRTSFRLVSGKLWGRNNNPDVDAEISTLTATFGVRGTEFTIEANDQSSKLTVHEGVVRVQSVAVDEQPPLSVNPGEQAVVPVDDAPQKTLLEPLGARNAVQWTVAVPELLHLRPYLKQHVANKVAAADIYEAYKKKITPIQ